MYHSKILLGIGRIEALFFHYKKRSLSKSSRSKCSLLKVATSACNFNLASWFAVGRLNHFMRSIFWLCRLASNCLSFVPFDSGKKMFLEGKRGKKMFPLPPCGGASSYLGWFQILTPAWGVTAWRRVKVYRCSIVRRPRASLTHGPFYKNWTAKNYAVRITYTWERQWPAETSEGLLLQ